MIIDISIFSTQELPLVLRSLTTVAANPEALTQQEQQFLQVIMTLQQSSNRLISDSMAESLITPSQIAQVITYPHHRKRLLQMAIVMAMVDGETAPQQQKALRSLARFDLFRRMLKKFVAPALHEEGIVGVKKIIESLFFKRGEYPSAAEKYRQLEKLPKGTLGYAFWQHYTKNRFAFPGEAGGIPERLVFHDLGHMLSGYDTSPEGEIQQGAFQAGFVRKDGFTFLLFVILQFHWGIKITPIVAPSEGLFDIPLVIHALQRGSACTVDLSDHWDFWEVVDLPLEEVRKRYGIPPFCPPSAEMNTNQPLSTFHSTAPWAC